MDGELVFLKLGGSVITDKSRSATARPDVLSRLAAEIGAALVARPDLRLVLGHGSGSFGHTAGERYATRQGVRTAEDWRGFAEVAAAAARLNRLVADALLQAGVPAWSLQPSASARCRGGVLVAWVTAPIEQALAHGLVPLVYGDVSLDEEQGGTIISTEQILAFLARRLRPDRLVLAGEVHGVFDADPLRHSDARPIPEISPANWSAVCAALGGSHGTDVTGGMLAKVEAMMDLIHDLPGLTVRILSGSRPGVVQHALCDPGAGGGTLLHGRL